MSLCVVCKKECVITTDVKCVSCENMVHRKCAESDLGVKTRSGKDWKCKDCKTTSSSHSSAKSESSATSAVSKEFMEEFKSEVFKELRLFKSEMVELSKSVQFISDKLDASAVLMEEVKNQLSDIKKENNNLKLENVKLSGEVSELRERVRSLEQYSRKNNIEVSGIPSTAGENVLDVVKDLGRALQVEVKETDVSAAHRVPSYNRDRQPSLVVQFQSKITKDLWIANYRKKKNLTAHDVNSCFPGHRVYVNDHLSPENKQLLSRMKQKSKDLGYSFAWCRDGKFFVRKAAGDPVRRINSFLDIDKLK